jgi:hypothetical protein
MFRRFMKEMGDVNEYPQPNFHITSYVVIPGAGVEMTAQVIGPRGSLYEFRKFDL